MLSELKAELEFLASIFTKDHQQLRIVSWQLDELKCQFLVPPAASAGSPPSPLTLHCTLTESYPSSPPMWFMDSDDPDLTLILERLEESKPNSSLCQQLKWLICELCSLYHLPEHLDVKLLDQLVPMAQKVAIEEVISDDEEEDAAEGLEDLGHYELQEDDEGLDKEHLAVLENIRRRQRQEHLRDFRFFVAVAKFILPQTSSADVGYPRLSLGFILGLDTCQHSSPTTTALLQLLPLQMWTREAKRTRFIHPPSLKYDQRRRKC